MSVQVETFYDELTFTLTYLVYDPISKDAVLIDPVMNYEPKSSSISYDSINEVEKKVKELGVDLKYSLETHAHADHLSGAVELKRRFPKIKTGISKHITSVQDVFKGVFNMKALKTNGEQFDFLLDEGEDLDVGSFKVKTIFTPGHTPACASFLIEDKVFTGDALFMPDFGTGRCDFPSGSAEDLYESIHEKLYKLDDQTEVYVGHDYQPGGRELRYKTSIGESKKSNVHLKAQTAKEEFVLMRNKRDEKLDAPYLLLPSIQVNIRGGHLPKEEDNGRSYLKMPLTIKE